jgi:phosphatidate cytidylyltransferase
VLLIAPVLLRSDPRLGFAAIIFLFVIVWFTDITAYFVGRAIGGPKLMPRVSPNKTWSGAVGGTLAAVIGGVAVAQWAGIDGLVAAAVIALLLSVISQAGDLLESAIKRRFAAKDASQLIPGHGGLMDRLDGFVAAAFAGALIGLAHGGFDAPARGLMVW